MIATPLRGAIAGSPIDFEAYPATSIDGVAGWRTDSGSAFVAKTEAYSGTRALILAAGASETEAVAPWVSDGSPYVNFNFALTGVKAVVSPNSREFMNIAGALAAVVREDASTGRLWVLDIGAKGASVWVPTASVVTLDSDGGVAGWVTLAVSIDLKENLWSLRVGDDAAETGIRRVPESDGSLSCRFYGYAYKSWSLDDLAWSASATPVVEGGPSGASAAKGGSASSGTLTGGGISGVAASASGATARTGAATSGVGAAAGVKLSSIVYVDATKGNDNNDGTIAYPKATLRAAFAIIDPAGAEVHAATGTYRLESKRFPAVKFVTSGRVIIK